MSTRGPCGLDSAAQGFTIPSHSMDQDGRLLASVLRARAAHSGSRGLRPGWLLAVLLVLPIIGGAIAVRLVVARVAIQDPVAAEARGLGTVQPIPEHAEELSATPAPQL